MKKQFHPMVWFLIIGTAFSRAGFFLSMPFLALHLQKMGLSALTIGFTIGSGAITGVIAGFFMGHISDRFGRVTIMATAMGIWSFVFVGFASADQLHEYVLLSMANGLCRAIFDPVSHAYIADLTPIPSQRKKAFHWRYYAINLGAAGGPLLGATLMLDHQKMGFLITSAVYFSYFICFLIFLFYFKKRTQTETKHSHRFRDVLAVIGRDVPLRYFLFGFFLLSTTYAQIESTLPQILTRQFGESGISFFGLLLTVNGVIVIVCQPVLTRVTESLPLINTVCLGIAIYAIGYLGLIFAEGGRTAFMSAFSVLTLGEILMLGGGNSVFISMSFLSIVALIIMVVGERNVKRLPRRLAYN